MECNRQSRNAPPPVEIYEMPVSTPYFSMAAHRVAAAAAGEGKRLAVRDRIGDGPSAFPELIELEDTNRTVPEDRPGRLQNPD
jgi:hypothetical protein